MTTANNASPDRSALVYRHHERLYRLALLVSGDADAAAALLQKAYLELPTDTDDTEVLLVRALVLDRPARRRWRWAAGDGDLPRSTLDRAGADALLGALARLAPAERMIIGLTYISGCLPQEIGALLGAISTHPGSSKGAARAAASASPPTEVLARFRAEAARAAGLVPAGADLNMLTQLDRWLDGLLAEEDAIALRRAALEQPHIRELRDGMIAVRELLPRAIPALFAAAPPRALTERLLKLAQGPPRARVPRVSARRAQGLLALGVLALAAAIILVPSLLSRTAAPSAARPPTVEELIDAAIHRFDHAPLQAGVLHEQYRAERDGDAGYVIDRWYDYAPPNRLAISVKQEGRSETPLIQISSDGRSLVQFRNASAGPDGQRAIDAHVSFSEARAVLPLLRGQPLARLFSRGHGDPGDLGPLYLAQARAAGAAFLGQTTTLGRQAFLLTYRTEHPPEQLRQSASRPAQVVLTIDAQTYALLDVALIPEGTSESSARHPIQAQQFEVLPNVPDDRFRLPVTSDVIQRIGIASVRLPDIPDDQFLSLEDAARRSPRALLAPRQLPDAGMRGLAVAAENGRDSRDVVLLYEGEFQNVVLLPGRWYNENGPTAGEEHSAGDFRYRILRDFNVGVGLTAMVYRADTPDQRLLMILDDEYATSEEREATLQNMIASLTPVDERSLPLLRRNFQLAEPAAGGG